MQQQLPQPSPSYEADFYAWTQHQAKLLRAFKTQQPDLPEDLDLAHLAEEIEDLGKSELRGVTSLIRQILFHLIKAASDQHRWPTSTGGPMRRPSIPNFQTCIPLPCAN